MAYERGEINMTKTRSKNRINCLVTITIFKLGKIVAKATFCKNS